MTFILVLSTTSSPYFWTRYSCTAITKCGALMPPIDSGWNVNFSATAELNCAFVIFFRSYIFWSTTFCRARRVAHVASPWGIIGRRVRDGGEDGALRDIELGCRYAEVCFARGLGAGQGRSVGNIVQIESQDLVFRIKLAEADGEDQFFQFSRERLVEREECVPRDLLGDGRAALHDACVGKVDVGGAEDAFPAERRFGVKFLVFDGDRRVFQALGKIGECRCAFAGRRSGRGGRCRCGHKNGSTHGSSWKCSRWPAKDGSVSA